MTAHHLGFGSSGSPIRTRQASPQPALRTLWRPTFRQPAAATHAALAGIEADSEDHTIRSVGEIGIGKHHLRVLAAEFETKLLEIACRCEKRRCPTAVDPVKDTMSISACSVSAWPISLPHPVTTLKTPSGNPASANISAMIKVVADVTSLGLATMVQPGRENERHAFGKNEEREVPGRDQSDDTDRFTRDQSHHLVAKIVERIAMQGTCRACRIFIDAGAAFHFAARLADGFPVSSVSSSASSSSLSRIPLAALNNTAERWAPERPDQRRSAKALRATPTASFRSPFVQRVIRVTATSCAGLLRSNISREPVSAHLPFTKNPKLRGFAGRLAIWLLCPYYSPVIRTCGQAAPSIDICTFKASG